MSRNVPWDVLERSIRKAAAEQDCPQCGCNLGHGAVMALKAEDERHIAIGLLCHCTWSRSAMIEVTDEVIDELEPAPMPIPTGWRKLFQ